MEIRGPFCGFRVFGFRDKGVWGLGCRVPGFKA